MDRTTALCKLLQDDDPRTVQLLREQLASMGDDWVDDLETLANMDDATVSAGARDILSEISLRSAESDFDLFCRFFPEEGDLEEACWSLAAALMPEVNLVPYRTILKTWGRTLLLRVSGAVSTRERVKILTDFMAGDLCFRGNTEDYYNPENSLLPRVLDTRSGLPISLSAIAIFISHRAGMNVSGVNLPGHFIVRHGDVFFDLFHRGKILTLSDCHEILRCQGIEPGKHCFEQATPRKILQRMLCNLKYAYARKGNRQQAQKIAGWFEALQRPAPLSREPEKNPG